MSWQTQILAHSYSTSAICGGLLINSSGYADIRIIVSIESINLQHAMRAYEALLGSLSFHDK